MVRSGQADYDQLMSTRLISVSYALAKSIGVPTNRITGIVNGDRSISADTALRLGRYFGNSPEFWMNLQMHYDLEVAERRVGRQILRNIQPTSVGMA